MQSWGVRGGALQAEADDGRSGSEGAPAEEGHDCPPSRGEGCLPMHCPESRGQDV